MRLWQLQNHTVVCYAFVLFLCSVYVSGVCYTYCMYLSSCLTGFLLLSDFVSN